ncbi:MAG: hypothetical protein KBC11_00900 [Candidatus Pacebacteria bacterium]|nr:hypothetical protein [Candidatus Paceibacterota bacterium]
MESLIKSDIFFFVATIAVIVVSILTSVLIIYFIKTVRIIKNTVKKGSDYIESAKKNLDKQGVIYTLLKKLIPSNKK